MYQKCHVSWQISSSLSLFSILHYISDMSHLCELTAILLHKKNWVCVWHHRWTCSFDSSILTMHHWLQWQTHRGLSSTLQLPLSSVERFRIFQLHFFNLFFLLHSLQLYCFGSVPVISSTVFPTAAGSCFWESSGKTSVHFPLSTYQQLQTRCCT